MTSVLICMHGKSATAMRDSAEMICGKQEKCTAVDFKMGQDLADFKAQLKKEIVELDGSPICLTDLKGGTPFNTLVTLTKDFPDLKIITGTNIPMLLQLFVYWTQFDKADLVKELLSAGQKGIFQYTMVAQGDEEF